MNTACLIPFFKKRQNLCLVFPASQTANQKNKTDFKITAPLYCLLTGCQHQNLLNLRYSLTKGNKTKENKKKKGSKQLLLGVVLLCNLGIPIFDNCVSTLCDLVRKVKWLYNCIGSLEFPVGIYYSNLSQKSKQESTTMTIQLPTRPLGGNYGTMANFHASAWHYAALFQD